MKRGICLSFFIISFILFFLNQVYADNSTLQSNGTTTVSANIIGFTNLTSMVGVGIQVPDRIDFGNVTQDQPYSDEFKVIINNTGTVNVTVTPQLMNSSDKIFSYIYFRTRKSGNLSEYLTPIGEYSLFIKKGSGKTPGSDYCYASLDFTDENGNIDSDIIPYINKKDLIDYESKIVFYAMPA